MNAAVQAGQPARHAYDVIVIGAGPAGMAAATVAARAGLSTLLLDENPVPGGQVYRAVTTSPLAGSGILGPEFAHGATLAAALGESGAEVVQGATVWSLDRDRVVGVSRGGASRLLKAGRVILATGALERPFPIPGWTLPGVMTVGSAQTVLKSSGLVPSGNIALAGQGPLLWLLAAQVLRAGGTIRAILDTTPRANYLAALPHAPGFLASPYAFKGLRLIREVKAKVRVIRGVTKLQARGEGKLAEVVFEAGGRAQTLALDGLFLHQGVVPHVNLAMAAGVAHEWDGVQHCFRPVLGAGGATSVEGILIAGDGAGIAGGTAAAEGDGPVEEEAPPGSPERDWYVWSDTPELYKQARIIFTDTERSNWTWDPVANQFYWHRFFSHQPDLNFDNPAVVDAILDVMRFWLAMGVDGITVSPGYAYERAPDQQHFLNRRRTKELFRAVFRRGRGKGWQLSHSGLYLDFLAGNRSYHCTPWGNPTRNIFGWQKPCYLLGEGYTKTFKELMEGTDWDKYGTGNYEKCADCMVHCGFEASAVKDMVRRPLKALGVTLRGVRTTGEMAKDIPLDGQRRAEFVFSDHVGRKLADIRATQSGATKSGTQQSVAAE